MQRTVLRGVFQKIKKRNYAVSLPGTEIPHQHWCYHYPFSNPCLCFLFRRILTSLHHSIFPAWLPGYPWFYRTWCNKTSDTVLHFLLLSTDSLNQLFVQVLCTKIPRKGNVLGIFVIRDLIMISLHLTYQRKFISRDACDSLRRSDPSVSSSTSDPK